MGNRLLHPITERIRIWRNIVFRGWWKLVWGIYVVVGLLAVVRAEILPQENIPPIMELLPSWPWWAWALIGMGILYVATLEGAYRLIQQATFRDNWIDAHKNRFGGRFPPIPEFLNDVVVDYSPGMPVSKDVQLLTPSVQFWARLLPSQRDQLLEMVKWLGQDPRDYEEKIRRGAPPGGSAITQLHRKR